MASAVYHPTASQYASAATHLERRGDWRTIRIDGTRYVVMASGNSGRTYILRADGAGCQCIWYQQTGTTCSHMLAVYLAATMDELAEEPVTGARDIYTHCVDCGDLTELIRCLECGARHERAERLAAARRRVVEEWIA